MDFLVLSPPVCTPSEPASGAFILASALRGHGFQTGFFDLSLEFYHHVLAQSDNPKAVVRSLTYLHQTDGYTPMAHRSAVGAIKHELKKFSRSHPGWRLSAMDILAPAPVHSPTQLVQVLENDDPFTPVWETELAPQIDRCAPAQIIISVSYLSQLTGAISLARFLNRRGKPFVIGGSLFRSLHATGEGFELLQKVFGNIDISNGNSLLKDMPEKAFLDRLKYPTILSDKPYFSSRPILPLTLSTGCYWSKCLFCPDNEMKYIQLKMQAFEQFIDSIPKDIRDAKPVIHLLDSAMPKNQLRLFMPIAKANNLQFYGFARPEKRLLEPGFLEELAQSGCLMLQLGVESGSASLLERYNKGINPTDAQQVLQRATQAGIRTYVYLLFGLPGETEAQLYQTRQLIKNNIESVDFLNLSIFNLPKHCELTKRAKEFGIVVDEYKESKQAIELYRPFSVDEKTHRSEARMFISTQFTNDEEIRLAYLRTPKWFRAAHLALMKLPGRN